MVIINNLHVSILTLLLDNLQASWSFESLSTTCPGFDVLKELLIRHFYLPEVYEAMAALLLGMKSNHESKENVS